MNHYNITHELVAISEYQRVFQLCHVVLFQLPSFPSDKTSANAVVLHDSIVRPQVALGLSRFAPASSTVFHAESEYGELGLL